MSGSTLAGAVEASVVALAISGDDRAFAELVRRRQGGVRELMRRLSGDRTLADDLAQQAFVQAWRTIRGLRTPAAFGGWLRRVSVNVWLQEARRVRPPMTPIEDRLERADQAAVGFDAGDRVDLDRALTRLKPPERLCVVLAYAEGLSHAEIAEATGWPLGTVKSNVTRGAGRLRSWLTPEAGESDE